MAAYTNAEGRAFDIAGSTGMSQALGRNLTPGQALAIDAFRSAGIGGGYRFETLPISINALLTRSTLQVGAARSAMNAADVGLAWSSTSTRDGGKASRPSSRWSSSCR
ncbi:hypothetical protein [Hydrogenophaga sp. 2FB]|uniref:hypothetical protein n=1 Tax=Hydrogenophaga sp. 2FB TaxID=2502187 RepID=UPI00207BC267|nr:hypothetical protein [Hydrogenophaga sp. 2FB]